MLGGALPVVTNDCARQSLMLCSTHQLFADADPFMLGITFGKPCADVTQVLPNHVASMEQIFTYKAQDKLIIGPVNFSNDYKRAVRCGKIWWRWWDVAVRLKRSYKARHGAHLVILPSMFQEARANETSKHGADLVIENPWNCYATTAISLLADAMAAFQMPMTMSSALDTSGNGTKAALASLLKHFDKTLPGGRRQNLVTKGEKEAFDEIAEMMRRGKE